MENATTAAKKRKYNDDRARVKWEGEQSFKAVRKEPLKMAASQTWSQGNNFKPGFFDLNLRLLSGVGQEQLWYMAGEQEVERRDCPDCMKPVIRNMEAILTYEQKFIRHKVEDMMIAIHEEYPTNLNTIANMIVLFEKMRKPTSDLENKLSIAWRDNSDEGKRERARCLVEQGYVLVMDMHSEVRESSDKKVLDTLTRLHDRMDAGSIESRAQRKTCESAIQNLELVKRQLLCIPESCTEETKKEQMQAVDFFEKGLKKMIALGSLCAAERPIWQHHLGKAYQRVGSSSQALTRVHDKKDYFRLAIQMFVNAINDIPESSHGGKIYIARSYAYLGHLIETKSRIIKGERDEIPESLKELKSADIWTQPLLAFEKAKEKAGNDRVVLNRYALTLNKIQREGKSGSTKIEESPFKKAKECLDLSIQTEPTFNWFAYTMFMDMYITKYKCERDQYEKKEDENPLPNKDHLKAALVKGEECLKRKTTLRVLMDMAEVNYMMSINVTRRRNIRERVDKNNQKYLDKALGYLQRAMEHHQCYSHPRLHALFGKCLFDSGAHSEGIHSMKLAIQTEETKVKDPNNFRDYMSFLLQYYQDVKGKEMGKHKISLKVKLNLLREAWCMLEEGKKKYGKRLKYPLIGVLNTYPHEMMDILEIIFKRKREKLTEELISDCMAALVRHKGKRVQDRARELQKRKMSHFAQREDRADFEPEEGPDTSILSDRKYDFFVCHAEEDTDWVETILLPLLEKDIIGNSIVFKGCLRGRDVRANDHLCSFINDVHKVLFIISSSFTCNIRCQDEVSFVRANYPMTNKLIPVLRDDSTVPSLLVDKVPVDCTVVDCKEFTSGSIAKLRSALCEMDENTNIDVEQREDATFSRSTPTALDETMADDENTSTSQVNDPTLQSVEGAEQISATSSDTAVQLSLSMEYLQTSQQQVGLPYPTNDGHRSTSFPSIDSGYTDSF